jgi:hypothetical protein
MSRASEPCRRSSANVKTVLSSGNVVFDAAIKSDAAVARATEAAMAKQLGRTFSTIVRRTGPVVAFREPLKGFNTSKGAIQLPLDEPLPLRLIEGIVKFRVAQAAERKRGGTKKSATTRRVIACALVVTSLFARPSAQPRGELTVWTARAIATVLAEIQSELTWVAGVTVNSRVPDTARELIHFLTAPAAKGAIRRQGMQPAS